MTRYVAQTGPTTEWVDDTQVTDTVVHTYADCIDAAVAAYGKAGAAAAELGMREQHLSDARRGERTIAFTRLLPWLQNNPDSAFAFMSQLADALGMTVHLKPRVSHRAVKSRAVELIRHTAEYGRLRERLASEWDESPTAIDRLLDEPTEEIPVRGSAA